MRFAVVVLGFLCARSRADGVTCADVKASYKDHDCCGNPNNPFDENTLHPEPKDDCVGYGMILTDMDSSLVGSYKQPEDDCYYDVTIQSMIDLGQTKYTYIGQSHTDSNAPDGAFVYKKTDGSLLYKKIAIVDACNDEAKDLCFSCDHTMPRLETFAETNLLSKAMTCSSDIISVDALKATYSHYAWIQMSGQSCGSFIYQKTNGGPLVHKTCG